MSKKLVLVSALTALTMLIVPTAARANSVGVAAFAGKCHLAAPIGYPTFNFNKGSTIPLKCWFGAAPDIAGKNNATPSFWVGVQSGTKTTASSTSAVATGSVSPGQVGGPWCGHSTGSFSATDNNGTTYAGSWVTSAGGVLIIVGTISKGAQSGPFAAVVNAVPDAAFKGQSCTTGATQFFVQGVGAGAKQGPTK